MGGSPASSSPPTPVAGLCPGQNGMGHWLLGSLPGPEDGVALDGNEYLLVTVETNAVRDRKAEVSR